MPYGSCSSKAKMADENCLSFFDDDELKTRRTFRCDNLLEELLADAADSMCETETNENYSKTLRPTGKPN